MTFINIIVRLTIERVDIHVRFALDRSPTWELSGGEVCRLSSEMNCAVVRCWINYVLLLPTILLLRTRLRPLVVVSQSRCWNLTPAPGPANVGNLIVRWRKALLNERKNVWRVFGVRFGICHGLLSNWGSCELVIGPCHVAAGRPTRIIPLRIWTLSDHIPIQRVNHAIWQTTS